MNDYVNFSLFDLASFLGIALALLVLASFAFGALSLSAFFPFLYLLEKSLKLIADHGLHFVKYILLVLRTLKRNTVRTSLTYLATFVLVFVAISILSILHFIDLATSEKEGNLKGIITEKFHNPSGMPRDMPSRIWQVAIDQPEEFQPRSHRVAKFIKDNHITKAEELLTRMPPDLKPKNIDEARILMEMQDEDDIMKWSFIFGTIDPDKLTFESIIFLFAMEPRKLKTMMPGLEDLSADEMKMLDQAIAAMETNRRCIVVGKERLKALNKRVGDKITIYSKSYRDLIFECEIVGEIPGGRWDQAAAVNFLYFNTKLDEYEAQHNRTPHESAKSAVALVWLRLPNKDAFQHMAEIVNNPKTFSVSVKMETESSAYGAFLDVYRDLLWAARWLLVPAILATMSLVIANAISISVRERRTEMAVLKVLGFSPNMVTLLILGEALLVGFLGGMLSVTIAYVFVNDVIGGFPFPIAFFPKFFVPDAAFWWGFEFGTGTALVGSLLPALLARNVKASNVFAKVT